MVEDIQAEPPAAGGGSSHHLLVVSSDSGHLASVVTHHDFVHLHPTDQVPSEPLRGMSVEELCIRVAFLDGTVFAPLFPVGRPLPDCKSETVARAVPDVQFCKGQRTRLLKQVE
jgi:hypothetical protein